MKTEDETQSEYSLQLHHRPVVSTRHRLRRLPLRLRLRVRFYDPRDLS